MRMAMMAITTNNSISVNPSLGRRTRNRAMTHPWKKRKEKRTSG